MISHDPAKYPQAVQDEVLDALLMIHDVALDGQHRYGCAQAYRLGLRDSKTTGLFERLSPEAVDLLRLALTTSLHWDIPSPYLTPEGTADRRLLQWIVGGVWLERSGAFPFIVWAQDRPLIQPDDYTLIISEG